MGFLWLDGVYVVKCLLININILKYSEDVKWRECEGLSKVYRLI